MKQYNFTEARKNFASVLETAKQEGIISIYKRNGGIITRWQELEAQDYLHL